MKFLSILFFLIPNTIWSFTLSGPQKGWKTTNLEVNINTTNCPSDILDRLDDAFKLLNSVPSSSLKLSLGRTSSTTTTAELINSAAVDTPVVICDSQFSANLSTSDSPVDANLISGVGFAVASQSQNITYGGLILNLQSGATASLPQLNQTQQNVVIAHELGHMLGLGHSSAESALMYYSVGRKENFSLSKDDWDGLSYLYPRDELAQTNLAAGCGLVKNGKSSLPFWPSTWLLLIPLFSYAWLRMKNRKSIFEAIKI